MAASSPGTYAKKYGKENVPKNITLVNDELPLRVEAHSYHQVGEKTLRANRGAQSDCQVGEETLRANRGAQSDCQVTAQSACQAGEKTLRAGRDGSISQSHPPAVLKGNPKPLAEGKKKSVQFAGVDDRTKDDDITAATNSHPAHIPPVSLKDTQ